MQDCKGCSIERGGGSAYEKYKHRTILSFNDLTPMHHAINWLDAGIEENTRKTRKGQKQEREGIEVSPSNNLERFRTYWFSLHILAAALVKCREGKGVVSERDHAAMTRIILLVKAKLQCHHCYVHMTTFMETFPRKPLKPENYERWLIDFHDNVNYRKTTTTQEIAKKAATRGDTYEYIHFYHEVVQKWIDSIEKRGKKVKRSFDPFEFLQVVCVVNIKNLKLF